MADFRTKLSNVRIKDGYANQLSMTDSIANLLTGQGGWQDPQSHARYFVQNIDQYQLEASFRTSWESRKAHRIRAEDACREWRAWKADDADIEAIEREERRLGLQAKVYRALVFARLYGGSALLLGTGGDLARPLDLSTVKKGSLSYIHVLTRHEIMVPNVILDPGSPLFNQPDMYYVNTGNGKQVAVHPSRLVKFIGNDLPDALARQENQTWGDPLLQTLMSPIVNADTSQGMFAAMIAKFKVDTISIPNLTQQVSTQEGEDLLRKRITVAAAFQSMFNIKLINGGDGVVKEEWDTYQSSLAGIPEVMTSFVQWVCAAADVPMTRFAGMSPGGLNSAGLSDLTNYYDSIASEQKLDIRPRLEQIDNVLVRSALGEYPSGLWFNFVPLQTDNSEVRAKNAKMWADTLGVLVDKQLMPDEVAQEATKSFFTEMGDLPGVENAYDEYAAGTLEPIIEQEDEPPVDPLIPVDPTTGLPTQNRESRLFAANDVMVRCMADGMGALEAHNEALRLTDAQPRSLYVSRALLNADELQAWMTEQGLGELQPAPHVTILYSKVPVDWMKMGSSWADAKGDNSGELIVNAGGPRLVEPLGDRGAVLMFSNSDICWRHEEMVREGASHDYPDYIPHVSLTGREVALDGVRPYTGKLVFGPEVFAEIRED